MNFNKHSNVEGTHAFLSASSYHWINYDEEKLIEVYLNHLAALKGTQLHELASMCIKMGQKLPDTQKTLHMFVNDAIGFNMTSEQVLYYSPNAYGTADAISFRNGMLRIHDLKTGKNPASMIQLMVYAAYFCLEYWIKPSEIQIELRIYQNDSVEIFNPTAEDIVPIMSKIKTSDKIINDIKEGNIGL